MKHFISAIHMKTSIYNKKKWKKTFEKNRNSKITDNPSLADNKIIEVQKCHSIN